MRHEWVLFSLVHFVIGGVFLVVTVIEVCTVIE